MKGCPNSAVCPLGSATEPGVCVCFRESEGKKMCPMLNLNLNIDAIETYRRKAIKPII